MFTIRRLHDKRSLKSIVLLVILLFNYTLILGEINLQLNTISLEPSTKEIAISPSGTNLDENLYVEQIGVELSSSGNEGDKPDSIVHNAIITNRIKIMDTFDLNDPVLTGCTIFLSRQNSPYPIEDGLQYDTYVPSWDGYELMGFIYFNLEEIQVQLNTSLHILQNKLIEETQLDLKFLDSIENHETGDILFPLFGSYKTAESNENTFTIENSYYDKLPSDGIFNSLSTTISEDLSVRSSIDIPPYFGENIFLLHKFSHIEKIQSLLINNYYNQSDVNGFYLNFEKLLSRNPIYHSFNSLNETLNGVNEKISILDPKGPVELAGSDWGGSDLNNVLDYLSILDNFYLYDLMYKGFDSGFQNSPNYNIDLSIFNLIGFENSPILLPSQYSFDSILGWCSGLTINLYNCEVTNISPESSNFSRFSTLPLEYALFIQEETYDYHEFFRDFDLKLNFYISGNSASLTSHPRKKENVDLKLTELIEYIILKGIPFVPLQLINIPDDILLSYINPTLSSPLKIYKILSNGSIPMKSSHEETTGSSPEEIINNSNTLSINHKENNNYSNFPELNKSSSTAKIDFDIVLQNDGNESIWGVPVRIHEFLGFPNLPPNTLLTNTMRDLGYDIDSMFSKELPRFFPLDPFGQGIYTGYTPDLFEVENFTPYSPTYSQAILDNLAYLVANTPYSESYLNSTALNFNNFNSIYNPENGEIKPNSSIRINFSQKLLNTSFILNHTNESPSKYLNLQNIESFLINGSHIYTYENLLPASVKYTSENGLNIHHAESNSITILKQHSFSDEFNVPLNGTDVITNQYYENISVIQAMTAFSEIVNKYSDIKEYKLINISLISLKSPYLDQNFNQFVDSNFKFLLQTLDFDPILNDNWEHIRYTDIDYAQYTIPFISPNMTMNNLTYTLYVPNSINVPSIEVQLGFRNTTIFTFYGENIVNHSLQSNNAYVPLVANIKHNTLNISSNIHNFIFNYSYETLNNTIEYYLSGAGNYIEKELCLLSQFNSTPTSGILIKKISQNSFNISDFIGNLNPNQSGFNITYIYDNLGLDFIPPLFLKSSNYLKIIYNNSLFNFLGIRSIDVSKVITSVSNRKGDVISVETTITNEGSVPLFNISYDDSNFIQLNDPDSILFHSGSIYGLIPSLFPNESVTISASFKLEQRGEKDLGALEISFISGKLYTYSSNNIKIKVLPGIELYGKLGMGILCGLICIIYTKKQLKKKEVRLKDE